MLNFLRKFRRSNLNTRYLKYAVGEIVLVVIGILIALSINNWNEKRKEDLQAEALTINLKEELRQTLNYLDFTTQGINTQLDFLESILDIKNLNIDSINLTVPYGLNAMFFMTSYSQFFDPPSDVYKTAINDGTIRLIKDRKLTSLLQQFHQSYKLRSDQLIEEEYALGREISNYLSTQYSSLFEEDQVTEDQSWSDDTIKEFLLKAQGDGTFRYKLAERIQMKIARKRFIKMYSDRIKELLNQ